MKILMLVLNIVQQATYRRASQLASQLAQREHEVTLMATSPDRRVGMIARTQGNLTLVESPDLLRGSLRSGWDPWNVLNRIYWLSKQPPYDIVHAFESRPTVIFPARFAARRSNAPLIIDWSDWFGKGGSVEERPNPVIRTVLRPVETYFEEHYRPEADGSTAICTTLLEKALALGANPNRLLLLPNGSDTERLIPIPQSEARLQTGLPQDAFIIGYVGSIFGRDAQLMAQAFDLVSARIPQARLLVAGRCRLDVSRLVRDPDKVIQTGALEEQALNPYLAASDIFWLPLSDTNANRGRFPLKLTDYLAVGRPVVASAVGDVTQVLQQDSVGLLSQAVPEPFAQQTLQLFQNPDLRVQMGQQARNLAETKYHWSHLSQTLETFYTRIVQT
jgi:glycosyltransferase involved in cell wall biosynthesis